MPRAFVKRLCGGVYADLALMFPRGETSEQRDDADLDAELDRR